MNRTLLEIVKEKLEDFRVQNKILKGDSLEIFMTEMEMDRFRMDVKKDIFERRLIVVSDPGVEFDAEKISSVRDYKGTLYVTHDPSAEEGSLIIKTVNDK